MHPSYREVIAFQTVVVGAAADTLNLPVPFDLERWRNGVASEGDIALFYNAVEGVLIVSAATGTGGTPTLDVKLQSSPDNFATAGLIKDVMTFTQVTGVASELKAAVADFSDAAPLFQKDLRLNIVSDTASGDKTFTGKVILTFTRIAPKVA